jgi:cytoskeletal protein RodZ
MADMLKAFADDLKAVREENNISLRSISQQTRLSLSLLESLEHGDYTFQPQAYIRAFLKQYINSLGLDVDETLFDYDLARSGKYKPKRINATISNDNIPKKEDPPPPVSSKSKATEDLNITIEKPEETKAEEIRESAEEEIREEKKETPVVKRETPEVKPEPRNVPRQKEEKYYVQPPRNREKKGISLSFMNSPVVRNISLILFAALVLLGLYSLINILFLEGSKDKPEVIRQNFDDVVKEQEKKILGKRTPEEIQDSIRKAEQEFALEKDSITLKVTGLNTGVFYLVTDSVNYNKPKRIEFEKNTEGTFKARRSFYISSPKTESFKATVNDIPLKFDNTTVSKVKISRSGIVK